MQFLVTTSVNRVNRFIGTSAPNGDNGETGHIRDFMDNVPTRVTGASVPSGAIRGIVNSCWSVMTGESLALVHETGDSVPNDGTGCSGGGGDNRCIFVLAGMSAETPLINAYVCAYGGGVKRQGS